MPTCPFCNYELSELQMQNGRCPECDGPLSEQEQRVESSSDTVGDDDLPSISDTPEEGSSDSVAETPKVELEVDPHTEATLVDIDARKLADLTGDPADSPTDQSSDHSQTVMLPDGSSTGDDTLIDVTAGDDDATSSASDPPGHGLEQTLQSELYQDLAKDNNIGQTIAPRDDTNNNIQGTNSPFETQIDDSGSLSFLSGLDDSDPGTNSSLVIKSRSVGGFYESQIDGNDYQIIDVLGKGGVGVVYSAKQTSIDRNVALKMLHPKMSKDQSHRDKFLIEAVVIGDLNHPQIVPIYDLGKNNNNDLFYTMKEVEGTPWSDKIDELPLEENLDILIKICNAIAFAHFKGVIHRDLKPDNVMLGDFGEVLVMDWGLALVTQKSSKHDTIQSTPGLGGTPVYMSPEMVTGPIKNITESSDIYLLGALLFRVLTGKPPHYGKNVTQCVKAAAQNIIQKTELRGELIQIALKAMETKPEDRYATAIEFRDALKDFEAHAESLKLTAQAEKDLAKAKEQHNYQLFARAIFGFEEAVSLWSSNQDALDRQVYAREAYANSALTNGDFDLGLSLLNREESSHLPLIQKLEEGQYERDSRQRQLARSKFVFRLASVAFVFLLSCACIVIYTKMKAAESATLAAKAATEKEAIAKQNALDATQEALDANEEAKKANTLLFGTNIKLADEKEKFRIATIKAERSEKVAQKNRILADENRKLAEAQTYLAQIALAAEKIEENRFEEARETLAAYQNSPLVGWEWGYLWDFCNLSTANLKLNSILQDIAVSDDGKLMAVAGDQGLLRLWKTDAFQNDPHQAPLWEQEQLPGVIESITTIKFSPDRQFLATGNNEGDISLLKITEDENVKVGLKLPSPWVSNAPISSMRFSYMKEGTSLPNQARWLLVASENGEAAIWNLETNAWLKFPRGSTLRGHRREIRDIAISPDRSFIFTAGEDDKIQIWSNRPPNSEQPVSTSVVPNLSSDVEPYEIWKTVYWMHDGAVLSVDTIVDDRGNLLVVSGGRDGSVYLWNIEDVPSNNVTSLPPRTTIIPPTTNAAIQEVHFFRSPSLPGENPELQILTCGDDRTVQVWNVNQQQLFLEQTEPSLQSTNRNQVPVAERLHRFRGHGGRVYACASVPSLIQQPGTDHLFVSVGEDNRVMLWSQVDYRERDVFALESQAQILDATFNHDSRQIASVTSQGKLVITDLELNRTTQIKERELASISREEGHDYLANQGQFISAFPDQPERWFVTAGVDGKVIVWDLNRGVSIKEYPHSGRTSIIAVSPDQKQIVTGGPENLSLLNRLPSVIFDPKSTNEETGPPVKLAGHKDVVTAASFSRDGELIFTADKLGELRIYRNEPHQAETESVESIFSMPVHSDEVTNIHVLPDFVITTSKDYSVKIWKLSTDIETNELKLKMVDMLRGTGEVTESALSPDGRYFACCRQQYEELQTTKDGEPGEKQLKTNSEILVYDLRSEPRTVWTLQKEDRSILDLDFFHTKNWLLLTDNKGGVTLWDWKTGQEDLLKFRTGAENYCTRVDARSLRLVTTGGRRVQLWNFDPKQKKVSAMNSAVGSKRLFGPHYGISKVSYSLDDFWIATGDRSGTVKLWQQVAGEEEYSLQYRLPVSTNRSVVAARFSPVSSTTLLTAWEDMLILWTYNGNKWVQQKRKVLTREESISFVDYSPSGKKLLVGWQDGVCEIWNADTLSLEVPMTGKLKHTEAITCGTFSLDEQLVATGSDDKNARGILWKRHQNEWTSVERIAGHSGGITSLAFSPIHQLRMLSGSRDGTAKLWDISGWTALGDKPADPTATRALAIEELLTLRGHEGEVTAVDFDGTGQYLVTSSLDGKTIRWASAQIEPTMMATLGSVDLLPGESIVIGNGFEILDPVSPSLEGGVLSLDISQIKDGLGTVNEESPLTFDFESGDYVLEKDDRQFNVIHRINRGKKLNQKIGTITQAVASPTNLGSSFELQFEPGSTPIQLMGFLNQITCHTPQMTDLINPLEYKIRLGLAPPNSDEGKKIEAFMTLRIISSNHDTEAAVNQVAPINSEPPSTE